MQERIEKHEQVCEKAYKMKQILTKKRSPSGPDSLVRQKHKLTLNYPNSKWQKQHLNLLKKLRSNDSTDDYSEYISCPYCQRRFAPIPAEKHISKCKDIINKPKPPPNKANILPKLNDKNLSFNKEAYEELFLKNTPRNLSFAEIHNKIHIGGGFTERVGLNDKKDDLSFFSKKKSKIPHVTEIRSKSSHRLTNSVCKCGELLPVKAVYCMMCGLCKYS